MSWRKKIIVLCAVTAPAVLPAGAAETPCGFSELQKVITEVSRAVQPAVVHIQAILRQENRKLSVVGSGVIIDSEGLIVTNEHVVSKAEKVTVTIPEFKRKFPARVLGTDKQTDLAVIRIDPESPIPVATLGDSNQVEVGEWVLAIGNPYGLDGTVSFGIVSARGRNLNVGALITDFIQTDAMIDFGSSGGPLVNLRKEVVGINSMMQGRGIGFTIPVNTVLDIKKKIMDEGRIERGWMGITMQPLNRELAEYYRIPDRSGIIVNSVFEGSPAEKGGLKIGDIIYAFDGTPVECEDEEDTKEFVRMVARTEVGKKVPVEIIRGGKPRTIKIRVGKQPEVEPEEVETDLGFFVKALTDLIHFRYRLASKQGVFVSFVEQGSVAQEAGLAQAQVILEIEGMTVRDLDDFRNAMKKVRGKSRFLVVAQNGMETKYLLFKRRDRGRDSSAGRAADS